MFYIGFALIVCQTIFSQVFDNELLGNVSDRSYPERQIDQSSIILPEVNTNPTVNMGRFENYGQVPPKRGFTVQEISEMSKNMPDSKGFDGPGSSVSQKTLIENQQYPTYKTGVDLENINGLKHDDDYIPLLYGFLFIIFSTGIIIIYKKMFVTSNATAKYENINVTNDSASSNAKDTSTILAELEKLQSLKISGVITAEEFEYLKKNILG